MKSKTLLSAAIAGVFCLAGAGAWAHDNVSQHPESGGAMAGEQTPIRDTLDMRTGGFKGWGPMPNPIGPVAGYEPGPVRAEADARALELHLAEVHAVHDQVWIANAPLRADYENIGATRSQAGGFGRFFSRDR